MNRLWSGDFVLILVVALLSSVACQALNNGTPIYVAYAGGTNAFAGALVLEFSLMAAVARIVVGRRIDNASRRMFMVAGAAFLIVGTFTAVFLPILQMQVVFRAVQGIGFGTVMTAASTAAADVAPSERMGEALGYFGLGQSLGMAIGPSLAIVLMSFTWHESLFAGVAALSACLIVVAFSSSYERHPERLAATAPFRVAAEERGNADCAEGRGEGGASEAVANTEAGKGGKGGKGGELLESRKSADGGAQTDKPRSRFVAFAGTLFERAALPGAIPMVVACLGYAIIVTYVSKFGVENGISNPGLFFVLAAITMTAVRLGGGRLIDRMRPLALLAVPVACGLACFALLALGAGEGADFAFYTAGALFGLSMGLSFPLFNTVCVKCSPIERRGAASALYGLANDVGIGVGAVIWGAVIDSIGYTASFWGGAAMMAATFAVAIVVFPKS